MNRQTTIEHRSAVRRMQLRVAYASLSGGGFGNEDTLDWSGVPSSPATRVRSKGLGELRGTEMAMPRLLAIWMALMIGLLCIAAIAKYDMGSLASRGEARVSMAQLNEL